MPLKDDVHKFVDTHLREIKWAVTGLGVVGVVLLVKDLHLFSTFRRVSEIPAKFVTSNVTLQGCVRQVTADGTLRVQHEPVFTVPFSAWLQKQCPKAPGEDAGLLSVELAGVEMTTAAQVWLADMTSGRHVWFTLLRTSDQTLQCCVAQQKNYLFKMRLNEVLIREGLAPFAHHDTSLVPDGGPMSCLIERLYRAETAARRKRRGMWEKDVCPPPKPTLVHQVLCWARSKVKGAWERKDSSC